MHRDDVSAALFAWVLGMCYAYNHKMQMFPLQTFDPMRDHGITGAGASWFDRCLACAHEAVFRNTHPDGSYSDFECELMLKARRLFQPLLKTDDEEE